jgi:RNA polymerase sigma factor (sigma-70 family)
MSASGSISQWIEDLKRGDSSAAAHLWNRYHFNLLRFARRRLHGDARRVVDEEDLVATAFESFYYRATAGQYPHLSSRQQLWALLVTITDRKAVNNVRQHMACKRGGGRVRGESTFDGSDVEGVLACAVQDGPSPVVAAALSEMFERLDDDMRQVVCLKLDGLSNDEIAQRLNRSLATIERRLKLLRDEWLEELLG